MHKINSSGATRNVGINYLTFVNQNILSNVLLMLDHLLYRQRRFFSCNFYCQSIRINSSCLKTITEAAVKSIFVNQKHYKFKYSRPQIYSFFCDTCI